MPNVGIDKKAVLEFCHEILGLAPSKRTELFGEHASLAPWEREMLDDMSKYSSANLSQKVFYEDGFDCLAGYRDTFCRLMQVTLMHVDTSHSISLDAIAITFAFTDSPDEIQDIKSVIVGAFVEFGKEKPAKLRYYTDYSVTFVADNSLRNWMRTNAIWDVDAVLADILAS